MVSSGDPMGTRQGGGFKRVEGHPVCLCSGLAGEFLGYDVHVGAGGGCGCGGGAGRETHSYLCLGLASEFPGSE